MSDDDFKCLIEEFASKTSELLKQKALILVSTWTVLKVALVHFEKAYFSNVRMIFSSEKIVEETGKFKKVCKT